MARCRDDPAAAPGPGRAPQRAAVPAPRFRPRHALLVSGLALIEASCQAAVYGAGLGLAGTCVLQCAAGVGVTMFFTLWEVSLQEHVPGDALSRVSSFDYLSATVLMPISTALAGRSPRRSGRRRRCSR